MGASAHGGRRTARVIRGRTNPQTEAPVFEGQGDRVVKRYDIHWAMLDPVAGAEMGKQRPVVIVSLDVLNSRLQTVTICPLTSQLHPHWRSRVQVQCAGKRAEIAVDQIRTVSQGRLGAKIGSLSAENVAALRRLLSEMYGEG